MIYEDMGYIILDIPKDHAGIPPSIEARISRIIKYMIIHEIREVKYQDTLQWEV